MYGKPKTSILIPMRGGLVPLAEPPTEYRLEGTLETFDFELEDDMKRLATKEYSVT